MREFLFSNLRISRLASFVAAFNQVDRLRLTTDVTDVDVVDIVDAVVVDIIVDAVVQTPKGNKSGVKLTSYKFNADL